MNSIYGDNISYGAKISYSDKEIINRKNSSSNLIRFYADMYITITDGDEVYEYALEFQTIFDKEIAVRIFKYSFERAVKLADYSKAKEVIKLKMQEPYIILIEESEGAEKATLNVVQNMILEGESEEKIKKYTGVADKDIEKIRKILETQGEH